MFSALQTVFNALMNWASTFRSPLAMPHAGVVIMHAQLIPTY
jgi:hypothetical protein